MAQEQWIKLSSLFDTPDNMYNTCTFSQYVVLFTDATSETECSRGKTTSFSAKTCKKEEKRQLDVKSEVVVIEVHLGR